MQQSLQYIVPSAKTMAARRFVLVCTILLCLFTAPSRLSAATTIELPLTLRTALLQHSLARYLNPQIDKPVVLYQEGPYRYLHSDQLRLYIRDNQPHYSTRILAHLGFKFLGIWPVALKWSGSIDMTLSPYVDEQWQLRYRIVDSIILDNAGAKPMISGFVWKLAKRFLHPRLEGFSLDLRPPQQEIVAFLRACASPAEMDQIDATLNSIAVGTLRIDVNGIVVPLILTVPDSQLAAEMPLSSEAPLDSAEIESFQKVLEPWDAFLVFVIKSAGTDFVDAKMREQLFELLISSRYQLLPILAGDVALETGDPLRALFVDAWHQLRLIIEEAEERGLVQEQPLRYMTFVNAGDALLALDAAAPRLGMQITSDGLRRLARTLQPASTADPLHFDWEVDPTLRELFKFEPEPAPEPVPEAVPAEAPPALSRRLLDFLLPMVYAEEAQSSRSLVRWVPRPEELEEYQQLIGRLLLSVADDEVKRSDLDPRFAEIFQHLVPSTALIESCWRQFVFEGGQVTFLRSNAGSVGLMQINQNVWRGFYNLERLRWEIPYNIRAGSQILMLYLKQYGISVADKNGDLSYAPRSTYSVYNAGPRAVRRFMKKDSTSREKRVDERFFEIYQGIAAGGTVDLSACDIDILQSP
jgi:hypothetical protein